MSDSTNLPNARCFHVCSGLLQIIMYWYVTAFEITVNISPTLHAPCFSIWHHILYQFYHISTYNVTEFFIWTCDYILPISLHI